MQSYPFTAGKTDYILFAQKGSNEYFVELQVFEVVFMEDNEPMFVKKNSTTIDYTKDIQQANRVVEGSIKWDGCANLALYPDEKDVYAHYCSKEQAMGIGLVLGKCYEVAKELIKDKCENNLD